MMMRIMSAAGAALLSLTLGMTVTPSSATAATPASVVTDLNVRAGPGTQYPRVSVFPRGSRVNVIGCTRGANWCDVAGRGVRGWVSARYLAFPHRGDRLIGPAYGAVIAPPVISFHIGAYWDRHYRTHPWFHERSRFDRRYDRVAPRRDYRGSHADRWQERRAERRAERWEERRERRREQR